MSMPIALVRPAPEPLPGPPAADPADAGQSPNAFGSALVSALHGRPDRSREPRTERPERGPRAESAMLGERRDGGEDGIAGLSDEERATFVGRFPGAGSSNEHSAPRVHDGHPAADASGEASAVVDEADALASGFVPQSLELAMAPPMVDGAISPGAGVTPVLATVAPDTRASTSAAMPANPGDVSTVTSGNVRGERADDPGAREATRAAMASAVARDPMSVRRELDGLAPELRTRLERVIERMEQEFGFSVSVVETSRSQERQDALYARGRTEPGSIVTWTRQSKHVVGAAADVVIDGGYTNAAGFERLARVAREEGLRTLWPRDPGHVELPATVARGARLDEASARVAQAVDGASQALAAAEGGLSPFSEGTAPIPRLARSAIDPGSASRSGVPLPHTQGDDRRLPIGTPIVRSFPFPDGPGQGDAHAMRTLPFPGLGRLEGLATGPLTGLSLPSAASTEARGVAALGGDTRPAVGPAGLSPDESALRGSAAQAARGSAGGAPAGASGVTPALRSGGLAGIASVATVAHVARIADVAAVADVANPNAPPVSAPATAMAAGHVLRRGDGEGRGTTRDDGRARRDSSSREGAEALAVAIAAPEDRDSSRLPLPREFSALDGALRSSGSPVAGLSRSDATERIARVLRIQEAGNDRPLSSVLLRVDHPEGGEDRIRIDMRGRTIGTTLDVADPRAAAHLRAHASELQLALQRQGLEGEPMVVRSASRTTDAATVTASAIAAERDLARAASATAPDGGGSTARDSRNPPRASHEREGTDQQRSRQRRDGKGDTR